MLGRSSYVSEFLSEANLVLTRENYGNKMDGIIQPIRNIFLREKDLLAFSLARYCGAGSQLAFVCEWVYQSTFISLNPQKLLEENVQFYRKKVPIRLRGVPTLHQRVDEEIERSFLPLQMNFLLGVREDLLFQATKNYTPNENQKYTLSNNNQQFSSHELSQNPQNITAGGNKHLEKYLSREYVNQVICSSYQSNLKMFSEDLPQKLYLDAQFSGTSFLQIALPCLVGFAYQFNQGTGHINPNGIRWSILEEVLKQIAFLHQTGAGKDPLYSLERFLYMSRLSEKGEFDWWQKDPQKQYQQVIGSPEARELALSERTKVHTSAKNNLGSVVLPKKYEDMLAELLDWAFGQV